MSIITTYVCDISGVQGSNRDDFVEVEISTKQYTTSLPTRVSAGTTYSSNAFKQTRMLHKDAAKKIGVWAPATPSGTEPEPDPTSFEQKVVVLLKDWMTDIAKSEAEAAVDNSRN